MGTRSLSLTTLRKFARVESVSTKTARSAQSNPALKSLASSQEAPAPAITGDPPAATKLMEGPPPPSACVPGPRADRVPLSNVVADCVRRWFRDALEEAKAGDATMQVLVGQMYQNGYGVPQNEQKAKAWLTKASRYRSSVWKVSKKRPGYNASDSDSDEGKNDMS